MRPLLQHAQRSFFANTNLIVPKHPSGSFSNTIKSVSRASSVCLQCQYRASVVGRSARSPQWASVTLHRRNLRQYSGDGKPRPENETPEERLARVRADIALSERQEKERLEKERLEKERKDRERLEKERQERERQEKERMERERQEKERQEREQQSAPQKKPLPDVIQLPSSSARPTPRTESAFLPDVAELSASNTIPPSTNTKTSNDVIRKVGSTRDAAKVNIEHVAADQLPSHHQAQRWDLSKRFQDLMDDILPKLAVVTHKVNTFTGTDYSGIEALKREIKDQEQLVKTRRAAIEEAKQALDTALSKQTSAQKEVVALLERKHSWSDMDLERYMSLIRSEHINDQAVREAKEAIAQSENALEEARSQLEKRERAQYHEEQIWSDTIRRNSTWVTFGLMGLNIFLLLATMIVIEPWRRRRMVREIRNTLEAHKPAAEPMVAVPAAVPTPSAATPVIAAETNKVAENPTEPIVAGSVAADPVDTEFPIQQEVGVSSENTAKVIEAPTVAAIEESPGQPLTFSESEAKPVPVESIDIEEEARNTSMPTPETWQDRIAYIATDIISERTISMRRIDYTAAILQGAAAGAIITAAIVAMIVNK
ncbi:sensitivity to high expression protein she9 [Didymosphaeria variabile]|uniref:Sensitive to high expression protein 9, mitochondrial n=1 Tax=Didymosphaeria variabile TaxID=1932322 RepID=A0A9W8XK18_9PLEO|nr:sensitivity to high expression protein she9 [Didymosphaeria variabile]KAJ4352322.1 sensitivity to high expression protein she9 [Didymosphaeria variabile]